MTIATINTRNCIYYHESARSAYRQVIRDAIAACDSHDEEVSDRLLRTLAWEGVGTDAVTVCTALFAELGAMIGNLREKYDSTSLKYFARHLMDADVSTIQVEKDTLGG